MTTTITSPIAPPSDTLANNGPNDHKGLCLVDLSLQARGGAKGADTVAWAQAAGLPLPDRPNRAVRHPQGGLVARLSTDEVLLLGSGSSAAMMHLGTGQGMCFPLPRSDSHAWFAVRGIDAAAMFAKVCGVDLNLTVFADLDIAQTSVARINAIIIRDDEALKDKPGLPCYHVLADWTLARSLWDYLLDAMAEFDGRAVTLG